MVTFKIKMLVIFHKILAKYYSVLKEIVEKTNLLLFKKDSHILTFQYSIFKHCTMNIQYIVQYTTTPFAMHCTLYTSFAVHCKVHTSCAVYCTPFKVLFTVYYVHSLQYINKNWWDIDWNWWGVNVDLIFSNL